MKRRLFLKGLAAVPLAGKEILARFKGDALEQSFKGVGNAMIPPPAVSGAQEVDAAARKFRSYEEWARALGPGRIEDVANQLGWDVDVLELNLPMTTLVRIQRRRNRVKAEKVMRDRFWRILARNGSVGEWF